MLELLQVAHLALGVNDAEAQPLQREVAQVAQRLEGRAARGHCHCQCCTVCCSDTAVSSGAAPSGSLNQLMGFCRARSRSIPTQCERKFVRLRAPRFPQFFGSTNSPWGATTTIANITRNVLSHCLHKAGPFCLAGEHFVHKTAHNRILSLQIQWALTKACSHLLLDAEAADFKTLGFHRQQRDDLESPTHRQVRT